MSTYFIEKCRACDSPNKYADLFHKNNLQLLAGYKQLVPLLVRFKIGMLAMVVVTSIVARRASCQIIYFIYLSKLICFID